MSWSLASPVRTEASEPPFPAWVFVNGYRSVPFIGGKAHPSISESKQGRTGVPRTAVDHSWIALTWPSTNVWKEAM